MNRPVSVAICALGLGCGGTRYAGPALTPDVEATIRAAHPRAALEVLVPGPKSSVRGTELVRVLPTGAVVSRPDGENSVPLGSVEEIQVTNHARGALAGAGLGMLAGAAIGAGSAFAADPNCSSDQWGCSHRDSGMFFGGFILGSLGALLGLVVGGAHGTTTTYHFGAAPDPRP